MLRERILALNTRLWKPKEGETTTVARKRAIQDLASALLEQRDESPERRINSFTLFIENGRLKEPTTNVFIDEILRRETEVDKLENQGFLKIQHLLGEENQDFVVWVSPPGGNYDEARLMLFIREKPGAELVNVKALALEMLAEECIIAANSITFDLGNKNFFTGVDELRTNPISLSEVPIEFLEKYFKFPKVWQAIKDGEDLEEKDTATRSAAIIIDQYFAKILEAQNMQEQVMVGAEMELAAQAHGYQLQQQGSCGISNQKAQEMMGIFDLLAKGKTSLITDILKGEFFECPVCHMPIPSGHGITVCPHCSTSKDSLVVKCA